MDGSGYAHGLRREALSPLGRLLAVAEVALGALRGELAHLAHVSVALRAQPLPSASRHTEEVQLRLARLDAALETSYDSAGALAADAESPALKGALALAQYLLGRLRTGWYASGLWSSHSVSDQDAAEVESVEDELFFRLRSIERATRLSAGELQGTDARRLGQLCEGLGVVGR